MADKKEIVMQSGVLFAYDKVKHIATVLSGEKERLIEVVGKALDFIKSKKEGATIQFHQNARGQMDAIYDAAITAGQMPLGKGRTDQGDPEKAPNGPKDVTPAEFKTPATAPASAPTAAPAGQPAPAPTQGAKAAPAVPPAAAPQKGNGKLPQELREERICRMSCLKSAVDLLKDQPYLMAQGPMVQRKIVLVMAQDFTRWVNTGESPGEFTEGGGA